MELKRSFILYIITLVFSLGTFAQVAPPRLILFLVVDELDNDQLMILQSSLSDKGINRIAREGFRFTSVNSHDFSGYAGTRLTSMFSGVAPAVHGVVGEQWFDQRTGKFSDPIQLNPVSVHKSLQSNMARTFADYFKSTYGPKSRVGAITINSSWMAHSLGYNPDYFYAYNRTNGTFFDVMQSGTDTTWVKQFNLRYSTNGYFNRQWGPIKDITTYTEYRFKSPEARKDFRSFFYNMNDGGIDGFKFGKVAASPYANTLLRDFTVAFLVNNQFGYDETPDLLSVCFTSRPFIKTNGTILPAEKEDMLLQLDTELASLIDFLDIDLGRENYLIVLTAGANSAADQSTHGLKGLNAGAFEPIKVTSLVNLYLMAIHGQGKWVNGFYDGVVYLNRPLIESKGLLLKDFQEKVAKFLLEVTGVAKAIPAHDLVLENRHDPIISDNIFPMREGDVYVTLLQGWQTPATALGTRHDGFPGQRSVPFMFFGWQTNAGAWFENVNTKHLIPLLMKSIGVTHPTIGETPEIPVFRNLKK
jgi:hypothetical protein